MGTSRRDSKKVENFNPFEEFNKNLSSSVKDDGKKEDPFQSFNAGLKKKEDGITVPGTGLKNLSQSKTTEEVPGALPSASNELVGKFISGTADVNEITKLINTDQDSYLKIARQLTPDFESDDYRLSSYGIPEIMKRSGRIKDIATAKSKTYLGITGMDDLNKIASYPEAAPFLKEFLKQYADKEVLPDNDEFLLASGPHWDNALLNAKKTNRKNYVSEEGKSIAKIDSRIKELLDGASYESIHVGAGTGGGGVSTSKGNIDAFDINDTGKYASVLDQIKLNDRIYTRDGKAIDKTEILNLINARAVYSISKSGPGNDIASLKDNILHAAVKYNTGSEKGENVETNKIFGSGKNKDQTVADNFSFGLEFIKRTDAGRFKNIMRSLSEKNEVADSDFSYIAEIGQEARNQGIIRSAAFNPTLIDRESNDRYIGSSYQEKKSDAAGRIGEFLKAKGYTNQSEFSENLIKYAGKELNINPAIVKDLSFEEKLIGYDAIPKSGVLPSFFDRGILQPITNMVNTAQVFGETDAETYLRSNNYDGTFGSQKVTDKNGRVEAKLPSDRDNVWYSAIEGAGQFITQVALTKGIGGAAGGAARTAMGNNLSRALFTASEISNAEIAAGTFMSTYFQEYGSSYEDGLNKTGDPGKAKTMAGLNATAAALFEEILPDAKLADKILSGFKGNVSSSLADLIKKGGDTKLLAEQGKSIISKFLGSFGNTITQEVKEEIATNIANYGIESALSPETSEGRKLMPELWQTLKATAIQTSIPAIFAGGSSTLRKDFTKKSLHDAALNFESYKNYLNKMRLDNDLSEDDYNKSISLLSTHRNSLINAPEIDANGQRIPREKRLDYAIEQTAISINKNKLSENISKAESDDLKNKISESESVQSDIYNPKKISDEKEMQQNRGQVNGKTQEAGTQEAGTQEGILSNEGNGTADAVAPPSIPVTQELNAGYAQTVLKDIKQNKIDKQNATEKIDTLPVTEMRSSNTEQQYQKTNERGKTAEASSSNSDQPEQREEEKINAGAVFTPIKDINIDTKRFQPRETDFNAESRDNIVSNFNNDKLAPIRTWKDPQTGKDYVLSGHSRLEAHRILSDYDQYKKTYPDRNRADYDLDLKNAISNGFVSGKIKSEPILNAKTEQEAIDIASQSNSEGRGNTVFENATYISRLRTEGRNEREIRDIAKTNYGKNANAVIAQSYLNPTGKTFSSLRSFSSAQDEGSDNDVNKIANWIGRARQNFGDRISNAQEDEMFDFLLSNKTIGTATDFVTKIGGIVNSAFYKPDQPLNLARIKYKTTGEVAYDAEMTELNENIKTAQDQIENTRDRIANPNNKYYINPNDGDYQEVLKAANEKIGKLNLELQALNKDKLELMQNKGKIISSGLNQVGLFDVFHGEDLSKSEIDEFNSEIAEHTETDVENSFEKLKNYEDSKAADDTELVPQTDQRQAGENIPENIPESTNEQGADEGKNNEDKERAKRENLSNKIAAFKVAFKESRSQLNTGIDPKLLAAGIELVGAYINLGIFKFSQIANAVAKEIGEKSEDLLRAMKQAYAGYMAENDNPELDDIKTIRSFNYDDVLDKSVTLPGQNDKNVRNTAGNSEQNQPDTANAVPTDEGDVRNDGGRDFNSGNEPDQTVSTEIQLPGSRQSNPDLFSYSVGEFGDNELYQPIEGIRSEEGDARIIDGRGDGIVSTTGSQPQLFSNEESTAAFESVARSFAEKKQRKLRLQQSAENIPVSLRNAQNISETLPYLLPEQQDDVLKAEERFFNPINKKKETGNAKGMLFTNGTGTGKTFTGLGIMKRMHRSGKKNFLIVTPSQEKVNDWSNDGKKLGLNISPIQGIEDGGTDQAVTTYANFRQNIALRRRSFDLIIYDESHRIMENKKGKASSTTTIHYQLSNKDEFWALDRITSTHPLWIEQKQIREENDGLDDAVENDIMSRKEADIIKKRNEKRLSAIEKEQEKLLPGMKKTAVEDVNKTKVVFLSATPFKGHFNLRYANGYLFDWGDETTYNGYSRVDAESRFFLENFGSSYEWKYHQLQSKSDANPDAIAMQEIQFSQKLMDDGTLSGRTINSDYDYSREFPIVTGFNSVEFNKAFNDIFNYEINKYDGLRDSAWKVLHNYNYRTQLFESLKMSMSVDRIKDHIALGRKVVIFHRRQQANVTPPFATIINTTISNANNILSSKEASGEEKDRASESIIQAEKFAEEYSGLLDYEKTLNYSSVVDQIKKEFPNVAAFFNGNVPQKTKSKSVKDFNKDNSGINILVVQEEAGKEGISLHDITGTHQRVLMSLSMPVSTITALQIEGRIYRIGNESNAIFEYPLLGLDLEIAYFGQNINKRLGTTENLAIGDMARDLTRSFSEGVLFNATTDKPGLNQGIGGKDFDRKDKTVRSDFDKAILIYNTNQKNRKSRDNREGIDFYATPEPVGQKMVEFLDLREQDHGMEPSAGFGSIAMWFPISSNITAIEPSFELFSKLSARAGGGIKKILNQTFEDFNIINKFDGIAMNPPFGQGGKMAMDHLEKAFKHLKDMGRVVAIIPDGPSMQKRLDNFLYGTSENGKKLHPDAFLRKEIRLPGVTFQQAGTAVNTKIIVIDKITDPNKSTAVTQSKLDLTYATDIASVFDAIRYESVPDRQIDRKIEATPTVADQADNKNILKEPVEFINTKTSAVQFVVKPAIYLKDDFTRVSEQAKANNGYYSRFAAGFLFNNADDARKFFNDVNPVQQEKNVNAFQYAADTIRNLKINPDGAAAVAPPFIIPMIIWNAGIEIAATAIETGGKLHDAIKRAYNYVSSNIESEIDEKEFEDYLKKELVGRGTIPQSLSRETLKIARDMIRSIRSGTDIEIELSRVKDFFEQMKEIVDNVDDIGELDEQYELLEEYIRVNAYERKPGSSANIDEAYEKQEKMKQEIEQKIYTYSPQNIWQKFIEKTAAATDKTLFVLGGNIANLPNIIQEKTIGYLSKKGTDEFKKVANKQLSSKNGYIRGIAKAMNSLFSNMGKTNQDVNASEKFNGEAKRRSIADAVQISKHLRAIIENNKNALVRIDQLVDPEFYTYLKDMSEDDFSKAIKFDEPDITSDEIKERFNKFKDEYGFNNSDYKPLTESDLSPSEQSVYAIIKELYDYMHEVNYSIGKLTEKTYQGNYKKYSARLYDEFELPTDMNEALKNSSLKMDIDLYMKKGNLSSWKALHKLQDPIYGVTKRLYQTLANKAIYDYADYLTQNKREVVSDTEKPGYSFLSAGYGKLSNTWVRDDIAEDFKGYFFASHQMQKFYDFLKSYDRIPVRQFYKKVYTVYNPGTHLANIMGNTWFGFLSGINPLRLNLNLLYAKHQIDSYGDDYRQLLSDGVIGSDFSREDLVKKTDELFNRDATDQQQISTKSIVSGKMVKTFLGKMQDFYGATDDVYKLAAYRSFRQLGNSHAEAIDKVKQGFQNYQRVGKAYDVGSKIPIIGNPFGKFAGDLARIVATSIKERPLTAMAFMGSLQAVSLLMSKSAGENDEKRRRRTMRPGYAKIPVPEFFPEWLGGGREGGINLGWKLGDKELNIAKYLSPVFTYSAYDGDNSIDFLNKFSPLPIEGKPDFSYNPNGIWAVFLAKNANDPLVAPFVQLLVNSDFRGMPILDPAETKYKASAMTDREKSVNALRFLARAYVPHGGYVDDYVRSIKGDKDYYGRKMQPSEIFQRFLGYKTIPFSDDQYDEVVDKRVRYWGNVFALESSRMNGLINEFEDEKITEDQFAKRESEILQSQAEIVEKANKEIWKMTGEEQYFELPE